MASEYVVLNNGPCDIPHDFGSGLSEERRAVKLSQEVRKRLNGMKSEFSSGNSRCLDYASLKNSSVYKEYEHWISALRSIALEVLNNSQRKAFLLNIYNALTIHGILHQEVIPASVIDVKHFWRSVAYQLGENVFSLDDIEHGLLRGNRPHPATGKSQFDSNDPRLQFAVEHLDARIHFALNCGAKSCPVVSVYSEDNLDAALEAAAQSFCEQETTFLGAEKQLVTSKLFLWYARDFGETEQDTIRWILRYLNPEKSSAILQVLPSLSEPGGLKLAYSNYEWSLNKI